MKHHNKPIFALLALTLSLLTLTACGSSDQEPDASAPSAQTETAEPEAFSPAQTSVLPEPSFSFPYLGYTVNLPQELQDQMLAGALYMGAAESLSADGSAVEYAILTWDAMTPEQFAATIEPEQEQFVQWLDSLTPTAALGVYDSASAAKLDELTGLTGHTVLSEADGYQYVLSRDPAQDTAVFDAVTLDYFPRHAVRPGDSSFLLGSPDGSLPELPTVDGEVGTFTMEDLEGNTYTQDLFAENELTLVNLFATWCNPCVKEIPELERLHQNLKAQGVGVVGILLDGLDRRGNPDPQALEAAKVLAERTGATYPFLIPDETGMNGRLYGVDAVPETFFVDKNGNYVGEVYLGARNLEAWTEIVETELARLKEAQ